MKLGHNKRHNKTNQHWMAVTERLKGAHILDLKKVLSNCFDITPAFIMFIFGPVNTWEPPAAEHHTIQVLSPETPPGSSN